METSWLTLNISRRQPNMRKISSLTLSFYVFFKICVHASYGPPRLLLDDRTLQITVRAGTEAHLPCPVTTNEDFLKVHWYKDHELVASVGDPRYQVTEKGSLVIQQTRLKDSGSFICKAANQNEAVQVQVQLLVLRYPVDTTTVSPVVIPNKCRKSSGAVSDSDDSKDAPILTTNNREEDNIFQRPVGSSVLFRCVATGKTKPVITWFKDGKQLVEDNVIVGDLPDNFRITQWSLIIENLRTTDSGNYSCVICNNHGAANATFDLQVVDRILNKPELAGSHPVNTTVEYGRKATFQCRVRSQVLPHIQWLRQIKKKDSALQDNVIKVKGKFYRVLKSDHTIEQSKGIFLNKLHISEARESDSGNYICLGSTPIGYSFRSAFLTVVLPQQDHTVYWSQRVGDWQDQPNSLLVTLPIILGVLVGVAVTLAVVCHRRKLAASFQYQKGFESHSLQTGRQVGASILEVIVESHFGQTITGKGKSMKKNLIFQDGSYVPLDEGKKEILEENLESVVSPVRSELVFNGETTESKLCNDGQQTTFSLAYDLDLVKNNV
ncbi:fibroblast growth factor receptor-like 1 isoform X1 [Limulus polyphemus]|uniref:Fibroblast growth factor receptor-like 1 isoform X1 n=2 Tax=Limulus polyphemus TaxID=6850 RepID=A0ABM1TD74_LIMPO|nr:fibroblast growth factor receptor-like 1 isoform X1 [Limulus polyphemus]XP_022253830.1 fibroblast growth factor receptor-like 1 isoform X1 [Limulus polyphemus]